MVLKGVAGVRDGTFRYIILNELNRGSVCVARRGGLPDLYSASSQFPANTPFDGTANMRYKSAAEVRFMIRRCFYLTARSRRVCDFVGEANCSSRVPPFERNTFPRRFHFKFIFRTGVSAKTRARSCWSLLLAMDLFTPR